MSGERLPAIHHWNRISRDWFSEPKLVSACEQAGVGAAAGWQVLVARGALSQGCFADIDAITIAVRCHDIGIGSADAATIARALVDAGLVVPDANGYRISNWENYAPPRNAQAPSQRGGVIGITPQSRPDHNPVQPQSRPVVIEREIERKEKGSEGRPESPTTPVRITTLDDGQEVVYLPPEAKASTEGCSHGHRWVLQPPGSKDGRHWEGFWSGDHQLPSGKWCKDRRPISGE